MIGGLVGGMMSNMMGGIMGGIGDAVGGMMGGDKSNASDMKEALDIMKQAQAQQNKELAQEQAKMMGEATDRSIDQMNFDSDMADFKQDANQAQSLMNAQKEIATDAAKHNAEKTNEYNDKMRDLV